MTDDGLLLKADPLWGQPCLAYNVQGTFSDQTLQNIDAIQARLQNIFPLPLRQCPPHALHISIYALIPVRATADPADKERLWQEIAADSVAELRRLGTGRHRIKLHFDDVRIMPSAVIAVADDASGFFETIRNHFRLALPEHVPVQRYDMIHTTLARYGRNGVVSSSTRKQISSTPFSFDAIVTQIKLTRERVYPSLVTDDIASIQLL